MAAEHKWVSGAECRSRCGWRRKSWGGQFACPRCGANVDAFANHLLVRDTSGFRWWNPWTWDAFEWQYAEATPGGSDG